ncbi:hypothetical protein ABT288_22655, partial [Streptomyces sp. NPDC001093]
MPVVQPTENGTAFDVVCTGARTFTLIWSAVVPLPRYTARVTRTCRLFPPPSGNDSVCHPGSDTEPRVVTHRYSTCAGSRPTVNVAVNDGVCPSGGGQLPEYVVCAPATVTSTDCAGCALDDVLPLGDGGGVVMPGGLPRGGDHLDFNLSHAGGYSLLGIVRRHR